MYINNEEYFVERILGSSSQELEEVLSKIPQYYSSFDIPKANGTRTIMAISRRSALCRMQRSICDHFLNEIPLPTPAIGFIKGENYLNFLLPHVGKKYYLRIDISDFFGTITSDMIRNSFQEFFLDSESKMLEKFISLCTYDGHLPQGAVTSPAISNVVFRRLDQRILKYCQSFDVQYKNGGRRLESICYTRYADDLLFSSQCLDFSKELFFHGMIRGILKSAGFQTNQSKLKYGTDRIPLSGYVVSDDIHLSRKKLYPISMLLHYFGGSNPYTGRKYRLKKALFSDPDWLEKVNQLLLTDSRGTIKRFETKEQFLNYLCGYRSFLISVRRANKITNGNMEQLDNKIHKLEMIIDKVIDHG